MMMKSIQPNKKGAYLEAMALAERLHRQFLELIETELHRHGIEDINSVQALMLFNIGEDQPSVGELVKRGYYLGTNATYNVHKMVEAGYVIQERSTTDRRAFRVALNLWMGQLSFADREGHRQTSRRVGGAGEDLRDRLAALLPGVPGLENGGCLCEPRHEHRPACFEDDHGAGIGAGDGLDETVLFARQLEAWRVGAFGHPLVDEEDDRIGLSRRLRRQRGHRPVIEVHAGMGKLKTDRLER